MPGIDSARGLKYDNIIIIINFYNFPFFFFFNINPNSRDSPEAVPAGLSSGGVSTRSTGVGSPKWSLAEEELYLALSQAS